MTKVYDFKQQLQIGESAEYELDEYFSDRFDISAVDMDLQRLGIDRIFISKESGNLYLVEYKTDRIASKTGNIFVETISIDKDDEPIKNGWVHTSNADIIIYYVVPNLILAFNPEEIEKKLPKWLVRYRFVTVQNKGYRGGGLLVPIEVFRKFCSSKVINV